MNNITQKFHCNLIVILWILCSLFVDAIKNKLMKSTFYSIHFLKFLFNTSKIIFNKNKNDILISSEISTCHSDILCMHSHQIIMNLIIDSENINVKKHTWLAMLVVSPRSRFCSSLIWNLLWNVRASLFSLSSCSSCWVPVFVLQIIEPIILHLHNEKLFGHN